MRKLVYILSDGNVVTTLKEAQTSGKGYKATLIPMVDEVSAKVTKKRWNR